MSELHHAAQMAAARIGCDWEKIDNKEVIKFDVAFGCSGTQTFYLGHRGILYKMRADALVAIMFAYFTDHQMEVIIRELHRLS